MVYVSVCVNLPRNGMNVIKGRGYPDVSLIGDTALP